jgi:hypothetical protein
MYIARSIERLEENNSGIRIETSSATLSGQPAAKLVATSEGGDFQTVQILAVFGNNLAYIAQYSSAREDNDVNLQAMQQIVKSVEINPLQSWSHVVATSIGIAASTIGGVVAVKLRNRSFMTSRLLRETRRLFLAALGIETLCVASAEIGGIMGFYFFGFSALGIVMSYMLAYGLAGFVTFASILGRAAADHYHHATMACSCSCGSLLEHGAGSGFASNIKLTFRSLASGIKRLPTTLYRESNAGGIIRTSLVILVTAESACILVAATVNLLMYEYSVMLAIPLALLDGTLTVAVLAAYKSAKAMPVTE